MKAPVHKKSRSATGVPAPDGLARI